MVNKMKSSSVSDSVGYPEDTRFMHNYNPSGNPGYASNTQAPTNTPNPPTEPNGVVIGYESVNHNGPLSRSYEHIKVQPILDSIQVEPTVEKWEESKIDYSQSFTLGLNKDNTEMITITPQSSETMQASMSFRQLHRILSQVRSHSVQEAKAERAREIVHLLDDLEMAQPEDLKTDNWRNWKYIRNSIVDKYDLLASLKQEEVK